MMSEYYDHYHRWEPLAEFHFNIDGEEDIEEDENYVYCLCSRAFIRDGVKTYYIDKEYASESDIEVLRDSQSQELEDHSHVHFSLDTSYKVKCEKDEGASCYCSASHTDNYCSTDEHDPQLHGVTSNALQPSDSGADLTYQDYQSDYTNREKIEKMDQEFETQVSEITENYLSEDTWDKFWAINGERIIWASWIKKYSDYINPSYLDDNNDLLLNENSIPMLQATDSIYTEQNKCQQVEEKDDIIRERKFSYDSKVNPYKKGKPEEIEKNDKSSYSTYNKEEVWLPLSRRRSSSEHERIVSPQTFVGTDSMTNVTKMTLSNHDVTSSHVTSESTSTDGYSASSSPSDDQSNDQTRIANLNVDENFDQESEEMDTEQYWQCLWKKHFGEQYALHYAKYIECHEAQCKKYDETTTNIDVEKEKRVLEVEYENSDGNSQEMPSVIEVQQQVDKMKLEDKVCKSKKRNNIYIASVGVLLQNLLKEQQKEPEINEVVDDGDNNDNKDKEVVTENVADKNTEICNVQPLLSNSNIHDYSYNDGDDDAPDKKLVSLKMRDGLKAYYLDKEDASESDIEVLRESQSQELEDHSHVHFSLDTSCEKDEGASCYCSASHTDNYCSTDEHDPQLHGITSNALQPSDSGADLTYQDCRSDYTNHEKIEKMDQDFETKVSEITENYLSEDTWDKFWAINGERIIWASWIKKYSDYINPSYLDDNNDLLLDENSIPKPYDSNSNDYIYTEQNKCQRVEEKDDIIRERKFSYDSKVNPYKKGKPEEIEKNDKSSYSTYNKEDVWLPLSRRQSCSEHERIVSPRTFVGTDSMTNVTKMTLSSHDVTSSHVTSESTSTDSYSASSSPSDDQSNDQTRIANLNVDENFDQDSEEMDTEQYWQFLWKIHFGEQYALHYSKYIECHEAQCKKYDETTTNIDVAKEKRALEVEYENSDGNSQEMPSVIEVQQQVDKIKLEDKVCKPKKQSKKISNRYIGSVGVLLQNLLKEQQKEPEINEVVDDGDNNDNKNEGVVTENVADKNTEICNTQPLLSNSNIHNYSYDDGDDDPPDEKPVSLKRSHEVDEEEVSSEKIKATFEIMGFCLHSDNMPKGQLVYRKRLGRLRPPRYKKFGAPKKTYFDDDGNPCVDAVNTGHEYQEDREMQTDDECPEVQTDNEKNIQKPIQNDAILDVHEYSFDVQDKVTDDKNYVEKYIVEEAAAVALPPDLDNSLSDIQDNNENETKCADEVIESTVPQQADQTKRRRRQKRYSKLEFSGEEIDTSEVPPELQGEPKMLKYWKKRHSLFHRFDEGIKLDRESWFSVTPENVAWHIASKFAFDTVVDAFCGAGGNTIQFARTCKKVISIDIDPSKIEMAKHNASVYGVEDQIEFMVGDFFELAPELTADMVFLSPPWGGPNYSENSQYDIETMLEPKPASELMKVARSITSNIALYLPRNTRSDQILSLAQEAGGSVEVEQSYLDKRFVAITAYFY